MMRGLGLNIAVIVYTHKESVLVRGKMRRAMPSFDAPNLRQERALARQGHARVAGLDEAGRGAWAGPVVAAGVILPRNTRRLSALRGVRDSKLLTPRQREALLAPICEAALAVGVGMASHDEIDALGIVPATRLAMKRAIETLALAPDALLIDALKLPAVPLPQRVLFHADTLCLSVAAASIVAKVTRDRLMIELDARYPGYGFARHKGYGTAIHQQALAQLGPSAIHRMTFKPVSKLTACLKSSLAPCGRTGTRP
jgi:ribonuclease HII